MKNTKVGNFNELVDFVHKDVKSPYYDSLSVGDKFFPECDRFVHFKINDSKQLFVNGMEYEVDEDDEDELYEMMVKFLNHHQTKECYIIGPDY